MTVRRILLSVLFACSLVAQASRVVPFRMDGAAVWQLVERQVEPVYPPETRAAQVQGTVQLQVVIDERGQARPRYPEAAKSSRTQGTVKVKVLVSVQGRVTDAAAISGPDMLRGSSVEAVRQWTFEPLVRNGGVSPFEADIEVNYAIQ